MRITLWLSMRPAIVCSSEWEYCIQNRGATFRALGKSGNRAAYRMAVDAEARRNLDLARQFAARL
jgi:hypothetical protein